VSGGAADQPPERRRRLDPDRAAATRRAARHPPPQVVDTRRYQRMIGIFGLTLVVIVAGTFLLSRRPGTAGIPAGKPLQQFAAPLAVSTLNGAANLHPHCTLALHSPGALNLCLMVKRAPVVLAFFVTSSGGCEQEVTALQQVSHQVPAGQIQFAAVAVNSDHQDALHAVRSHHWTIPVGYDEDGRLGAAYGVEVCPIVELVRRGGIVAKRLIGEHWNSSTALAPQVRMLLTSSG
jgi:peroxiredoxin